MWRGILQWHMIFTKITIQNVISGIAWSLWVNNTFCILEAITIWHIELISDISLLICFLYWLISLRMVAIKVDILTTFKYWKSSQTKDLHTWNIEPFYVSIRLLKESNYLHINTPCKADQQKLRIQWISIEQEIQNILELFIQNIL